MTQSCSTTCFSTITGCSAKGFTNTSFIGDACVIPTSIMAEPQGPFETARWDYGLSCAGDCGANLTAPSSSVTQATSTEFHPGPVTDTTSSSGQPTNTETSSTPLPLSGTRATSNSASSTASVPTTADNTIPVQGPSPSPISSKPSCDPHQQENLQNMETTVFKDLVTSYCRNFDFGAKIKKELTNVDAGVDSFSGFKFHFNWEPKQDAVCQNMNCGDVYNRFSSLCKKLLYRMSLSTNFHQVLMTAIR